MCPFIDAMQPKLQIYGFILIKLKCNFFSLSPSLQLFFIHSIATHCNRIPLQFIQFSYYLQIYNFHRIELLCMLLEFLCNQCTCAHHKSAKSMQRLRAMNTKIENIISKWIFNSIWICFSSVLLVIWKWILQNVKCEKRSMLDYLTRDEICQKCQCKRYKKTTNQIRHRKMSKIFINSIDDRIFIFR